MVMRVYNPSQQEEDEMDRRFAEAVYTLDIVPESNNVIERIIFGVDNGYSSENRYWNKPFFLELQMYKKHYISMEVNINTGSKRWIL